MPPGRQWGHRLYQTIWTAVDWFYPPTCAGCGKRAASWCPECQASVKLIEPDRLCSICGQNLAHFGVCPVCQAHRPAFTASRAWAAYEGPLRKAHHRLKYQRDIALGVTFSAPMIALLQSLAWPVELVIPVPVGIARLRRRGYNQSSFLARPLALAMGLRYCPQALARTRETRSQVDLQLAERKENVKGAFGARPGLVQNRSVLVVDDIMTSGATLDACAAALKAAGAKQVFCLALARTPFGGVSP